MDAGMDMLKFRLKKNKKHGRKELKTNIFCYLILLTMAHVKLLSHIAPGYVLRNMLGWR